MPRQRLSSEYYQRPTQDYPKKIATTAAGIGLGLLALRAGRPALRMLGQEGGFLHQAGVQLGRGLSRIYESPASAVARGVGQWTRHGGPARLSIRELPAQLRQTGEQFRDSVGHALQQHRDRTASRVYQRATHMQTLFRDVEHVRAGARETIEYGYRMRHLAGQLRGEYGDVGVDIARRLARQDPSEPFYLRDPSLHVNRIQRMLEDVDSIRGLHISPEDLAARVRSRIGHSMFAPVGPGIGVTEEAIDLATRRTRDEATRALYAEGQRETFLEYVMSHVGFRRATIGEVMDDVRHIGMARPDRRTGDMVETATAFSELVARDRHFANLKADPLLFIDKAGNLIDYRGVSDATHGVLTFIDRHFQTPIININPLRLLQYRVVRSAQLAPKVNILGTGEVQQYVFGSPHPIITPRVMAGGRITDPLTGRIIRDDVVSGSARHGILSRVSPKIAGTGLRDPHPDTILGRMMNLVDVGRQDFPSKLKEYQSIITKLRSPEWQRNVLTGLQERHIPPDQVAQRHAQLSRLIERNMRGITPEEWRRIGTRVDLDALGIGRVDMRDPKEVMSLLQRLRQTAVPDPDLAGELLSPYARDIERTWQAFARDPAAFVDSRRVLSNRIPMFTSLQVIEQVEDVRRLASQELLWRLQQQTPGRPLMDVIGDVLPAGEQQRKLHEYLTLMDMNIGYRDYRRTLGLARGTGRYEQEAARAYEAFLDVFDPATTAGQRIDRSVKRYTPWLQKSIEWEEYQQYVGIGRSGFPRGQEYVYLGKTQGPIAAINEAIKQRGFDPLRQFGKQFTAGRHNMEEMTGLSIASYHFAERLSATLGSLGLGLSREHLGSMPQIMMNLMARRWVAGIAAFSAFAYMDYEAGKIVPGGLTGVGADIQAGLGTIITGARDLIGETDRAKRRRQLYPGMDLLAEESYIGRPLSRFGLTGDMSLEEYNEYLISGHDPVRRGRWWRMGSKTPWYGDRVLYYEPSWYQRAHMPDVKAISMYGSEDDKWRHHWMPTPRYPAAPIRHFLTDPYHLERELYWDRPYPETGPIPFLAELPLIGPTAGVGVSEILKPTIKMHQEELRDINRGIRARGFAQPRQAYAYVTPSGMIQTTYMAGAGDIGREMIAGTPTMGMEPGMYAKGKDMSRAQLTGINQEILTAGMLRGGELPAGPVEGTRLIPLRDRRSMDVFDDPDTIDDIMSMTDPRFMAGQTWYSFVKHSGIYGFLFSDLTMRGMSDIWQPAEMLYPGPVVERARINTMARSWWDRYMGGLGDDISEIYRRFIPRERRVDYWNPIPNTMPYWMPGPDYFVNFQEGDPFVQRHPQLMKAEMRLPGRGYEAVHDLHPDQFGEYGAFDRFKILADIAPYSDEYRFWRDVATQTIRDPELRSEMADIRRQVATRKRKYEFHPYRFRYADIEEQEVTVTRVIDQNTFMTREFPDHPIRLAGVRVNQDEAEYVERFIRRGATLRIGYTADERHMVADDTYGTIRATVWADNLNINRWLIERGYGTERETDYSPAGVYARFTEGEITRGRLWERFAHLDTPLHTRFLAVRSPLETYERKELYGKCITGDVLVQTTDGLKPASEVTIGDIIKTHTGSYVPVAQVSTNHISLTSEANEILNIYTGCYASFPLKVTREHPILVKQGQLCIQPNRSGRTCSIDKCQWSSCTEYINNKDNVEWIPAEDIKVGDYIAYPRYEITGASDTIINVPDIVTETPIYTNGNTLYVSGIYNGNSRQTRSRGFPRQLALNDDIYRLIGYYLAEGSISRSNGKIEGVNWSFNIKEQDLINDVTSILMDQFGIESYIQENPELHIAVVRVKSRILGELILKLAGDKKDKHISEILLQGRESNLIALIKGYWLGDGYVNLACHNRTARAEATSVSSQLIMQLRDILTHFGIVMTVDIQVPSGTSGYIKQRNQHFTTNADAYRILTSGRMARELAYLIDVTSQDNVYGKRPSYTHFDDKYVYYRVNKIINEPFDDVVYDFGIDHDDHSFCTIGHAIHNSFQRWRVMDQLGPTFESFWAKGPVGGTLLGGTLGFFFGSGPIGRMTGVTVGALIGGIGGAYAGAEEALTGEVWIPRRRRIEREINQYFDILEYLKHTRLFEQARRRAIFQEGIDPLEFIERHSAEGDERMMMRRELEQMKREEVVHGNAEEAKIKRINQMLRVISETKEAQAIGPYTLQALQHHAAKSSTLYGVDPYGAWMDIFRALPSKDRPFFPEFMKASPEERERILQIVPEDQRRIYQAKWGLEVDERPDLEAYFSERYLPGADWAGWSPDVHLEDIKYKVIKNEALDMTEFGIWEDVANRAQMLQLEAPDIHQPNQDVHDIRRELHKITRGMGLEDVFIEVVMIPDKLGVYVDIDISDDMMERFREALHEQPELAFA